MTWQTDFTAYTTGCAFFLRLSHDMVSCLVYIADYDRHHKNCTGWTSRTGRSNFIPTMHALKRRGLVEHNEAARLVGTRTPGIKLKWIYRLTPAGENVLELLKMAHVVAAIEATEEVDDG